MFGAPPPGQPQKVQKGTPAKGYVAMPGTGPVGETCGSCRHMTSHRQGKIWHKCDLYRARWTGGRGTDVLVRSPACSRWESADREGA